MNDSGDVTEDGEEDVDEQVCAAAALEEDADGGEEDGEDDLADVAGVGVSCGEFENGGGWGGCVASIAVLGEVDLRAAGGFEAGERMERGSYLAVKAMMKFVCEVTSLFELVGGVCLFVYLVD